MCGSSESTVRLLSALCGSLVLPLIYLVGRQLFDKEAGLVARSSSPFHQSTSVLTRGANVHLDGVTRACFNVLFPTLVLDWPNKRLFKYGKVISIGVSVVSFIAPLEACYACRPRRAQAQMEVFGDSLLIPRA